MILFLSDPPSPIRLSDPGEKVLKATDKTLGKGQDVSLPSLNLFPAVARKHLREGIFAGFNPENITSL